MRVDMRAGMCTNLLRLLDTEPWRVYKDACAHALARTIVLMAGYMVEYVSEHISIQMSVLMSRHVSMCMSGHLQCLLDGATLELKEEGCGTHIDKHLCAHVHAYVCVTAREADARVGAWVHGCVGTCAHVCVRVCVFIHMCRYI